MDDTLSVIVEQAIEQAEVLCDLDAPRAEVWASDLISIAVEASGAGAIDVLLDSFDSTPGVAGLVAASSVRSVASPMSVVVAAVEAQADEQGVVEVPEWLPALGSSRCDGAWVFTNRGEVSAVFRFVDSFGAGHVVAVDLVPGSPETVGDVTVGPADVVDLADDPEVDITANPHEPKLLAARAAQAMSATDDPRESFVANAHLLAARLATLVDHEWIAPTPTFGQVPDLPERDPDDDEFALHLLSSAVNLTDVSPPPGIADAADRLRAAARDDHPIAQWLAASRGPVDLDETDGRVVLFALGAAVAPSRMEPLDDDVRMAIAALEWADWLGAVIGLVREGVGASVSPTHLVDLVNACPEVASSIPKYDRARVERALEICGDLWNEIGLSADGRLTEAGVWALPRALRDAWQRDPVD